VKKENGVSINSGKKSAQTKNNRHQCMKSGEEKRRRMAKTVSGENDGMKYQITAASNKAIMAKIERQKSVIAYEAEQQSSIK